MNAKTRRQLNRLRCDREHAFTPHFGTPVPMRFGDTPAIGDATTRDEMGRTVPLLSRANHRHEFPPPPSGISDLNAQNCFYFNDFAVRATAQSGIIQYADATSGFIFDSPPTLDNPLVDPGGWGWQEENGGTANPAAVGKAGIFLANGTVTAGTNDTTASRVLFDRLVRMRMKVRLVDTSDAQGDLAGFGQGCTFWVGGLVTATNKEPGTATDGAFFQLTLSNNASGIETWHAVTMKDGARHDVDTGVVIPYQPVGTDRRAGAQTLEMDYDPDAGSLTFWIQGRLVATITENLPVGKYFCGWGFWIRTTASTPTQTVNGLAADFLTFKGRRVVLQGTT